MFHEALDPAAARVVGVPHMPADLGLQVEGQPLFGAACQVMKMAADRPKEVLSALKTLGLLCREHARLDELADIVGAVDVFGDPEQGVEVTKPALAFLYVGLQLVPAVSEPLMARIALGELVGDELR